MFTSGCLGTLGYRLLAVIGGKIAHSKITVIDIAGDGSIQMNIQQLSTAVRYKLPVIVAILNNHFLGMVRQWQGLFFDKRYSASCIQTQPDFVKVAESYGALGLRAKKASEVVPVIKEALAANKPVVIDFEVAREENVYPMVPAGAPVNEMLLV